VVVVVFYRATAVPVTISVESTQWRELINNSTAITAVFQMIVLPGSLLILFRYVFQNRTSRDKWCTLLMGQMAFLILSPNRVKALKETVRKSKQDICSSEYY